MNEHYLNFKKDFEVCLNEFLDSKQNHNTYEKPFVRAMIEHAAKLVSGGGKRIRPYIAFLSYQSVSGNVQQETSVMKTLIALEIFHAFALMHDDIIDSGLVRHDVQTMHEYVGARHGKHQGMSQAILVGDLLFNWAWEIIVKESPRYTKQTVAEIFAGMADQVIVGQMLDVALLKRQNPTLELIIEKTELKTAHYTFVNPIKIGMALADGLTKEREELACELGLALGLGFQLQDDLLDIIGDSKKMGKGVCKDIEEGQHTFFTHYVRHVRAKKAVATLNSVFGKELTAKQKAEVKMLFEKTGAIAAGEAKINAYFKVARQKMSEWSIGREYKQQWISFLDFLVDRLA